MLARHYTGTYNDNLVLSRNSGILSPPRNTMTSASLQSVDEMGIGMEQPRSSMNSAELSTASSTPRIDSFSWDDTTESSTPISLLPFHASESELFHPVPTSEEHMRPSTPSSVDDSLPPELSGVAGLSLMEAAELSTRSVYSVASSRTASTDYGRCYTRWAISQETLSSCCRESIGGKEAQWEFVFGY
ncbi:hypothetical protein GALMADRAFT_478341 [Galerina marginata CBS 339.88]|uniref:Uncharacterized protein n=1 Tax=Galerina marginata (strain CBS 339.88) TaxID=685588 RepID=A0A067T202_GALM3|nr:hypothetical protein GALMADRAFT_478341 [Galerina marginata CBS 339.88]